MCLWVRQSTKTCSVAFILSLFYFGHSYILNRQLTEKEALLRQICIGMRDFLLNKWLTYMVWSYNKDFHLNLKLIIEVKKNLDSPVPSTMLNIHPIHKWWDQYFYNFRVFCFGLLWGHWIILMIILRTIPLKRRFEIQYFCLL